MGENLGVCRERVPESPSCDGGFAALLFRPTGLEIPKERRSRAILLVTIVMPDE
jgi:hypothetical protein